MKRVSLFLLAILTLEAGTAQPPGQYRVDVTIKESVEKGRAYLRYFTD